MRTRAALARDGGWEVVDVTVGEPGPHEALVRVTAAGFGRLDQRVRVTDGVVGGHEGVGVVDRTGPAVTRVQPGDTVVLCAQPVCGTCRFCSTGRQSLCERGTRSSGFDGGAVAAAAGLGTLAGHVVVSEHALVPLPEPVPDPVAALLGATVPTGWGTAVRAARVAAGDTVVVYGAGGVGATAVIGARLAGARHVVAVDPVAFKRERASAVGATVAVATAAQAHAFVVEATWGRLAEHALVTVGETDDAVLDAALDVVGKTGTVTVAAHGGGTLRVPSGRLIGFQRRVQGTRLGDTVPLADVPRLVALHTAGRIALDALVTRTYTLDEIDKAARDLDDGSVVRGVVVHDGGAS